MNLTLNQKVAFAVAVLGFLAAGGSAADLAQLFGNAIAKSVAAAASLGTGIGGIYLSIVTGQGSAVKEVLAMPGIESVKVNAQANPALAAIAVDPAQQKIEPTAEAAGAVAETAKAA